MSDAEATRPLVIESDKKTNEMTKYVGDAGIHTVKDTLKYFRKAKVTLKTR